MTSPTALHVDSVSHRYGQFQALDHLSLEVGQGEIFALLGPNGSGKTTLFRLISTLLPLQNGEIELFGRRLSVSTDAIRRLLGIVFQAPSLDPKLTVLENIRCQAALYGIVGREREERIGQVTRQLGIQDRTTTRCEDLSGGLKRRVELAKGILHRPKLLLMDEPSTGLDPASRLDMWRAITDLRDQFGVTVLLTTHLLEEADKADRIAILHLGKTVAVGSPSRLRSEVGDRLLRIHADDRAVVGDWLRQQNVDVQEVQQQLQVNTPDAAAWVEPLSSRFGDQLHSLTLGQPSLEDVFIARTGHRFHEPQAADSQTSEQ
jgi:ABC-2 type transport system ATP-binding protein